MTFNLIALLDHIAVLVFAVSGALRASRAQLDLVGFAFLACLTAVGGGTIRDVLLQRDAVFWIASPSYIVLGVAVSVLVFFTAHLLNSRLKALEWADAIALGVAVAAGSGLAIQMDQHPVIVALMGVATGCFGGMMRDIVCNEVPLVLKKGELYATATLAGSLAMILASYLNLDAIFTYSLCVFVTFFLRAGGMVWGWTLPTYRSRPPRK